MLDKYVKKLYIIRCIFMYVIYFCTGEIIMSIKNKTAAILMALMTLGTGVSGISSVISAEISANAASSSTVADGKAPTAKSRYSSTDSSITISWDKVSGATGYYIYRWSKNAPAWVKIGTAPYLNASYTDKKVNSGSSYKYYVVAYKMSGGKRIMSGRSNEISAATLPSKPKITDNMTDNNYITVVWTRVAGTGYEVSFKQGSGAWKVAGKTSSADTTSFDIKGLTPETLYSVRVRAISKDADGNTVYGDYSDAVDVKTAPDFVYRRSSQYLIDRLDSAKLNPGQTTYEEIDRQDTEDRKSVRTISDADLAAIKKFVDAHFTSDMTTGEFLDYTVQWLNKNISYADGVHGPQYSEIWNRSHVDNCLNYKVGQCIQYNSTICAIMRYLGYDARVIQGWRGNSLDNKWQHFWCEVTINGTDYVMDSYNYGTDGDWYFVCATYSETAPYAYNSHYIMNRKLMAPFKGYITK